MKIKTNELTGTALDWAVAKCEGFTDYNHDTETMLPPRREYGRVNFDEYSFSTDWSQGGAIIEREICDLYQRGEWYARVQLNAVPEYVEAYGDTPLIAAMRCYVASKLGDEVDVPQELDKYV